MNSDTKKLIKTFFTIVVIMVLLIIILFIFMALNGKKVTNDQLLVTMENAAKKYYAKNVSKLPSENDNTEVTTTTLISEGYMKSFDKLTSNKNCTGKVIVTNNGGNYIYNPSLKCDEYNTSYLSDKLKSNVVTSGDGLYQDGNTYYYRGEYVNNYIKLGDKVFRIMSIDGNLVKVIDPVTTNNGYPWDNRYTTEVRKTLGINNYAKSRIKEYNDLKMADYENIKKYIIKSNWCIEKRNTNDFSIHALNCSENVEDYIGMINTIEYTRVSLDTNCSDIRGGSCNNYNYISNLIENAVWTSVVTEDNTYQAYIFSNGFSYKDCISEYKLLFLFNINGNLMYISGDGSKTSPYIVR